MSGSTDDAFWTRVLALTQNLNKLSYYHLLDVAKDASADVISKAYYRRVQTLHPDRHAYETDPTRKRALVKLYARFGEAFRVLRSPELRRAYDEEFAAGRARLTPDAQRRREAEAAGPDPKTPHARKLLDDGRTMIQQGNVAGGLAQLKLAAKFEPDSKAIQAAVEAGERAAG
jgi:DnaJ-class molecular chaperone